MNQKTEDRKSVIRLNNVGCVEKCVAFQTEACNLPLVLFLFGGLKETGLGFELNLGLQKISYII